MIKSLAFAATPVLVEYQMECFTAIKREPMCYSLLLSISVPNFIEDCLAVLAWLNNKYLSKLTRLRPRESLKLSHGNIMPG